MRVIFRERIPLWDLKPPASGIRPIDWGGSAQQTDIQGAWTCTTFIHQSTGLKINPRIKMPAPAVYVIAVVGSVAAAVAFKEVSRSF